jgi:hypothetical protein
MNTLILKAALAVGALILAGCATTAKKPVSFAAPSAPSDAPPKKGNYTAAYAYAQDRMTATDYAEAAIYFARAAEWVPPPGTDGHIYEFENYVNAAWAAFLAGDKGGAHRWLDKANALDVQAAPSDRARYLDSLLSGDKQPALPPNLKSTLPW